MAETIEYRFWSKVAPVEPRWDVEQCWLWTGAKAGRGYGVFRITHTTGRSMGYAHRIAYELEIGPTDLELDHKCRVHACVNPAHLEPVSHSENMLRGRDATSPGGRDYCLKGHKFTPENTKVDGTKRRCRTCFNAYQLKFRLEQKG